MTDDTDTLRFNDLAKQYALKFRRGKSTYQFDDFTAHRFNQALGFVEGYDRAAVEYRDTRPNVYRLEASAVREILADDNTNPAEVAHREWLHRRLAEETQRIALMPTKLDTRRRR